MDGGTQDQLEPVGGNPETSLYFRKERLNLSEEAVSLPSSEKPGKERHQRRRKARDDDER